MYKKRIVNFSIIILLLAGLFSFSLITEQQNRYNARVNATSTIQKVRNFEDLTAGNMNATAFDNSFYNGEIVADGKITTTQTVKIDDNTLGIRVLGSDPRDRYITIQVAGYTKILIDIIQDSADTSISTGCGLSFSGKTLIRDIEIPTYGYHEIILTFKVPSNLGETAVRVMGIDNIRFYGIGDGSSSGSSSSSQESSSSSGTTSNEPPSSNPDVTRENTPPFIGTMVTMRGIADFLETKENHYPLSDAFIEDYQQTSGGYIDLAKRLGLLVDKSKHEPNQKWHFFDSWLYPSIDDGSISWDADAKNRVYTRLLCPELLLWIYEASGVPVSKVQDAMDVAIAGKINGTHVSTIAKNMRECVPWSDIYDSIYEFWS